jgi:putative peptidoglycan lipid II flippase
MRVAGPGVDGGRNVVRPGGKGWILISYTVPASLREPVPRLLAYLGVSPPCDSVESLSLLMSVQPSIPPVSPQPLPRKSSRLQAAALTMIVATLLSRVLGMARDIVIAYAFGQDAHTDAYITAFRIPDLMTYLIAGGALSATFLPVFSEHLANDDECGAWRTFSVVATITLVVGVAFVILAEIFTPSLVLLLNHGYIHHPEKARLAAQLARIVLPSQIFFLIGGLLMGTQNARGRFLIPALGPSIYNVGIIAGALLAIPLRAGLPALMWGALAGAFLGNFLLQLIAVRGSGVRFAPSLDVKDPGAVKVWKLMLPIVLGASLPNVDPIINGAFASNLPDGAQTALQYANRLMLIPIGIFAQATAVAVFPSMTAQAASKRRDLLRGTIYRSLSKILFLTVPASALFVILAEPIVACVFQHGKFHTAETQVTAQALRCYSLGIFAWSAQAILTRGFYAIQDSRYPVISGTVMTFVFIGMNAFVIHHTHWGVAGLALATSVAAALHAASMYVVLRKRMRGLASPAMIVSVGKILLSTAALGIVAVVLDRLCTHLTGAPTASFPSAFLHTVLPGLAGILAYLLTALALRMPEAKTTVDLIRRVPGKR